MSNHYSSRMSATTVLGIIDGLLFLHGIRILKSIASRIMMQIRR